MKTFYIPFLIALLLGGQIGCTTTNSQTTSGKILATTTQTVDLAMKGWMSYVKVSLATGKDVSSQEQKVREAYIKYQIAEQAAEKAYVASAKLQDPSVFSATSTAMVAAQNDLLTLINTFNPPNK